MDSYILRDFQLPISKPIPLYCDNMAAIYMNPVFHERTKHLDMDCHFIRDKVKDGFISPQHIPSHSKLAYSFTKALSVPLFRDMVLKLGSSDCYQALTLAGMKKYGILCIYVLCSC